MSHPFSKWDKVKYSKHCVFLAPRLLLTEGYLPIVHKEVCIRDFVRGQKVNHLSMVEDRQ